MIRNMVSLLWIYLIRDLPGLTCRPIMLRATRWATRVQVAAPTSAAEGVRRVQIIRSMPRNLFTCSILVACSYELSEPQRKRHRDHGHQGSGVDYRPRNWAGKCHQANWQRAARSGRLPIDSRRGAPSAVATTPGDSELLRQLHEIPETHGIAADDRGARATVLAHVAQCRWLTASERVSRRRGRRSAAPRCIAPGRRRSPVVRARSASVSGASANTMTGACDRRAEPPRQERPAGWRPDRLLVKRFDRGRTSRRRNVTQASGEGPPPQIPRTPRQPLLGSSMV